MVHVCADVFVNWEVKVKSGWSLFEDASVIESVGELTAVKTIVVLGNGVVTGGSKAIIEYVRPVVCFLGIEDAHKTHVELPKGFEYSVEA